VPHILYGAQHLFLIELGITHLKIETLCVHDFHLIMYLRLESMYLSHEKISLCLRNCNVLSVMKGFFLKDKYVLHDETHVVFFCCCCCCCCCFNMVNVWMLG